GRAEGDRQGPPARRLRRRARGARRDAGRPAARRAREARRRDDAARRPVCRRAVRPRLRALAREAPRRDGDRLRRRDGAAAPGRRRPGAAPARGGLRPPARARLRAEGATHPGARRRPRRARRPRARGDPSAGLAAEAGRAGFSAAIGAPDGTAPASGWKRRRWSPGVKVRGLGSAGGGGLPQWNCGGANAVRARAGAPALPPRSQASLAVSADGERWSLLAASPDAREQLAAFAG